MSSVLPLSSVEVLVLRGAGSQRATCLESFCAVMSSISPTFEHEQVNNNASPYF